MSDALAKPVVPLARVARRALGVLIEKAFCTPDAYPLTVNALVAGSSQKSAREPVMEVTPDDIELALDELKSAGLVECIFPASGRTERWRHVLKEAWGLEGKQRAVLAELLLRGPQTEGDLRARVSRMQDIPTLDELADTLQQLAARGLAIRLSPEGQKRGVAWMHGLYLPEEAARLSERLLQHLPGESPEDAAPAEAPVRPVGGDTRVKALEEQVRTLSARLEDLTQAFDALQDRVERLSR